MYEKAYFEQFSFLCIIKIHMLMIKFIFLTLLVVVMGVISIMSAFMKKPKHLYDGDASI